MKISELIIELHKALYEGLGDEEVYFLDRYSHYPIKWVMQMNEPYGDTPKGFYIRMCDSYYTTFKFSGNDGERFGEGDEEKYG